MPHQRRKLSHGQGSTSTTDVRRAVTAAEPPAKHRRPPMVRRHTPGSAQKLGRGHRERERDWQGSWDDERESFPQFCMTCEKQFVPNDQRFLYCSETCRRIDQSSTPQSVQLCNYVSGNYAFHATRNAESRDIIPRATPSRPTSMHLHNSPPASPGSSTMAHPSSAISALRSLSMCPSSPPSPTGSSGSSIWPFGRSAATSPGNSYTRPSAPYLPSTFDTGYHYGVGAYTYDMGLSAIDRPLPSRHPSADSRPKSIELVTPVIGR